MFISIIIPTRNRETLISKTLDYLDNQNLSKNLYEILVVDDGSIDETERIVKERVHKCSVRYLKKMREGPGAARNLGIKHAKGDIIAFTDDDCIIPSGWLKNIYDSFINNPDIAGVEGKTITFINKIHPLSHQVVNLRPKGVFPTCNIAYKKQNLEKIGGFYHKFQYPHNEDVDLAWNVLKHGNIIFKDSLIIIHPSYHRNIFKKLIWTYYFVKYDFLLFDRHRKLYKELRCKNPWKYIYFDFYIKCNYFFLLRKYIKYKKLKTFSILTFEIAVFLILQGLLLFFLVFFFIYRHNKK